VQVASPPLRGDAAEAGRWPLTYIYGPGYEYVTPYNCNTTRLQGVELNEAGEHGHGAQNSPPDRTGIGQYSGDARFES
jgi:hypothetical protein